MFIDPSNFAINDRVYNPAGKGPYTLINKMIKIGKISGKAPMFLDTVEVGDLPIINMHTSMGLPFFYENSCVGRAVYGVDLESLSEGENLITGLNTINRTPFHIVLDVWEKNTSTLKGPSSIAFPRKSYMKVFCYYDIILLCSSVGI